MSASVTQYLHIRLCKIGGHNLLLLILVHDFFLFQYCSYDYREGDRAGINNGERKAERIPDKGTWWLLIQSCLD
jgi:hypothetical protein